MVGRVVFLTIMWYDKDMPLYIVRHGESTANHEGVCAGHVDVDLTLKGTAQAVEAGNNLPR